MSDIPVVITRPWGSRGNEVPAIMRPAVFVDIKIAWRNLPNLTRCEVDQGQPLIIDLLADYPALSRDGLERSRRARRIFGEQDRDCLSVRRPSRRRQSAGQIGKLARTPSRGVCD